jgi:YesN/AraC family two-component response regulator
MLETMGYKVLAAASPSEAIRLAREHRKEIHVLMTDVIMPEMNGPDLADRLMTENPGLKQIFMSGYTANLIARHGVLVDGVQFLQKPFMKKDLAEKMRLVFQDDQGPKR